MNIKNPKQKQNIPKHKKKQEASVNIVKNRNVALSLSQDGSWTESIEG